jgi:hypothetical protein
MSKSRTLLLVLLVPAVLYGVVKGLMYYNARETVDGIVDAAAGEFDIRYQGISTEIRGAVSVDGITVQPLGSDSRFSIDRVRVASDDIWFFLRGGDWRPGETAPPNSLSFQVVDIALPLDQALLAMQGAPSGDAATQPCANGLQIEPALLRAMGFDQLGIDADGAYRIDAAAGTLELGMNLDLRDIQSIRLDATLTDVDTEAMAQGAPPNLNLGRFSVALQVAPTFGSRALAACAEGSDETPAQWSDRLAARSIAQFEQAGLDLGSGLRSTLRDFYRDWGVIEITAAPAQPVGLLSLMFLPPEKLADALALRLSLNGELVTDTRFEWRQSDQPALAALLGNQPPQTRAGTGAPQRVRVRRAFESVAVGDLAGLVEKRVRLTPRGLPTREGVLKGIANGIAEVEQTVHGGRYTAYVPLDEIEMAEALIQREIEPGDSKPGR